MWEESDNNQTISPPGPFSTERSDSDINTSTSNTDNLRLRPSSPAKKQQRNVIVSFFSSSSSSTRQPRPSSSSSSSSSTTTTHTSTSTSTKTKTTKHKAAAPPALPPTATKTLTNPSTSSTSSHHTFETMAPQPTSTDTYTHTNQPTKKLAMESHNYESDESEIWRIHEKKRRAGELFAHTGRTRAFIRWTLTAVVAILTQVLCVFIIGCTTQIEALKFGSVLHLLGRHHEWYFIFAGFLLFLTFCISFAVVAGAMVVMEPACAGSGIADVRSYLNGVDMPQVMGMKTLVTKIIGTIFAQASGLPLGFEGPIVHCGAIVGSLFSQGGGKVWGLNKRWRLSFEDFRNDKERRDFVACGTAAGIAAAFGAPIGGVFYCMEEGASYWSLKMTWRCFFCAITTALVGYVLVSGLPTAYVSQFYFLDPFPSSRELYHYKDLGIFAVMGVCGGMLGAMFNQLNRWLTVWRLKHVTSTRAKMVELLGITALMACLSFFVPFAGQCKARPPLDTTTEIFTYTSTLRPFLCREPEGYNELASLFFNSWDDSLRILFHLPMYVESGEAVFSTGALLAFFVPYFVLAFLTFGSAVPSGLFIPSLLSGATLGRIVGQALHPLPTTGPAFAAPGIYALIGASSVLGGMTRMTISLALILLEATGNLYLLIPLSLTLFLSRWMGNFFNEGIYDMHIQLKRVPFLLPQCPKEARVNDLRVGEIMSTEINFLRPIESVARVVDMLLAGEHHVFPLLEEDHTVFGSISRDVLCTLLYLRAFRDVRVRGGGGGGRHTHTHTHADGESVNVDMWSGPLDKRSSLPQSPVVPYEELESFYPHFPELSDVCLSQEERDNCWIDLRPYCNTAPYVVMEAASVPRTFRLFRMGMRHLLVINRKGQLVGIVTRHDLSSEHVVASLAHSPMLLSPDVWKMDKSFLLPSSSSSSPPSFHKNKHTHTHSPPSSGKSSSSSTSWSFSPPINNANVQSPSSSPSSSPSMP